MAYYTTVTKSVTGGVNIKKSVAATTGRTIKSLDLHPSSANEVRLKGVEYNTACTIATVTLHVLGSGTAAYNAVFTLVEEAESPTFINIKDYGGVGNNSTDNTAAIAAAIAALPTTPTKGGVIYFPAGMYRVTNINLDSSTNVQFIGDGGVSGGNYPGSALIHTGTSGSFISARSSSGFTIKDMTLERVGTLASTDSMIDLRKLDAGGDTAYYKIDHCFIKGATSSGMGVNIGKSINGVIRDTHFMGHTIAIRTTDDDGSGYANGVRIEGCTFHTSATIHIRGLGAGFIVSGCTFEPLTSGAAGAISCNTSMQFNQGVLIQGCWTGDVTTGTNQQFVLYGQGISVFGNFVADRGFDFLAGCEGVVVKGNTIYTDDVAGIRKDAITDYDLRQNFFFGTNPIVGYGGGNANTNDNA